MNTLFALLAVVNSNYPSITTSAYSDKQDHGHLLAFQKGLITRNFCKGCSNVRSSYSCEKEKSHSEVAFSKVVSKLSHSKNSYGLSLRSFDYSAMDLMLVPLEHHGLNLDYDNDNEVYTNPSSFVSQASC